jgi:hypothetical protein
VPAIGKDRNEPTRQFSPPGGGDQDVLLHRETEFAYRHGREHRLVADQLSPLSGDFDATGSVLFETSTGKVVTVNIAFDNSTTLVKQNVSTVFGSVIAS